MVRLSVGTPGALVATSGSDARQSTPRVAWFEMRPADHRRRLREVGVGVEQLQQFHTVHGPGRMPAELAAEVAPVGPKRRRWVRMGRAAVENYVERARVRSGTDDHKRPCPAAAQLSLRNYRVRLLQILAHAVDIELEPEGRLVWAGRSL